MTEVLLLAPNDRSAEEEKMRQGVGKDDLQFKNGRTCVRESIAEVTLK